MKHFIGINIKFVLAVVIFFCCGVINAYASTEKDTFFSHYRSYQSQAEAGAEEEVLGKQASALATQSKSVFGNTHINTINLTISAANHYRNAQINDKALVLYDTALGLYKESDEDRELDFANLLMEILSGIELDLSSRDRTRLSNDLYDVLNNYFDEDSYTDDTLHYSLMMFNSLVEDGAITRKMRSLSGFSKTLVNIANEKLAHKSNVLIRANYNVGRLAESRKRKNDAIEYYTKVVDIIEQEVDYDHPYALGSHARLVSLFESKGESEEATKHCVAIGKMTPWEDDLEPMPLYRKNPKYPINYAKRGKEGYAIIQFDITPYGFVANPRVLEVDGSQFAKAGIEALTGWRYAPKFVDGQATTAKDRQIRLEFTLGSRNKSSLNNS